ncbi:DUF2812 domain-containing protein [Romboutsia sp.]|uniref:DUF2812 domain-containing protein n=1 Tax=Romboutsia sp. TaxID=1965302 RepID=UPI003F3A3552
MERDKNVLVKRIPFKENECKALEKYLEEKALEGWVLYDRSMGTFKFKKAQPKKCKYAVDIFTDLYVGEYRKNCESKGWKYVCEIDKYYIFSSEDENITPIQIEEELMLKKVEKSMVQNIFGYILWILIIIRNGYNDLFNNKLYSGKELCGNYYWFIVIILLVFTLLPSIEIVRNSLWYFKYKKSIKLHEDIHYPTLKSFKIKMACFDLCIYLLGILIICLISLNMSFGYSMGYIFTGLAILAIISFINKIFKIIKTKDIMI